MDGLGDLDSRVHFNPLVGRGPTRCTPTVPAGAVVGVTGRKAADCGGSAEFPGAPSGLCSRGKLAGRPPNCRLGEVGGDRARG